MARETVEGFCSRCNMMSELQVRGEARATAPSQLFDQLDPGEEGLRTARYSIAFCPKCEGVFLHAAATSEPSDFPYEAMLFPTPNRRDISGLPKPVHRAFRSAQSCFDTGNFEPCVIMCRKCLEAVCVLLGVKDGSLAARLRTLRDSGHIDAKLHEWADELRLVGNDAAHDLGRISKQDAVDSLDFVEAILLYVFALDQRFREFRARREAVKEPNGRSNTAMQPDAPSARR